MLQVPVREPTNLASTKAVILVWIMQTHAVLIFAIVNTDGIPMNRSGVHPGEPGLGHCLSTCPRLVIVMPLRLCFELHCISVHGAYQFSTHIYVESR